MVNAVGPNSIVIESTSFFKLVKMKNAESDVKNTRFDEELFVFLAHTDNFESISALCSYHSMRI